MKQYIEWSKDNYFLPPQPENGQQIRTVSLSSDDDMIDITTTGTTTEHSIHGDEQVSHCKYKPVLCVCFDMHVKSRFPRWYHLQCVDRMI
jgi:hypothetical protein